MVGFLSSQLRHTYWDNALMMVSSCSRMLKRHPPPAASPKLSVLEWDVLNSSVLMVTSSARWNSLCSRDFHPFDPKACSQCQCSLTTLLKERFISMTEPQNIQLKRQWTNILKLGLKLRREAACQVQSLAFKLSSCTPPPGSPSFRSMLEGEGDTADWFFVGSTSSHTCELPNPLVRYGPC